MSSACQRQPGGYGGGGGGSYNFGGGGGGAPGAPGSTGGGYSYVTDTARDPFGITGGNLGVNGYVSINLVAIPELFNLGDGGSGLRWPRLAGASACAQTETRLTALLFGAIARAARSAPPFS